MTTQADIVEQVMKKNGGYASFSEIFDGVLKIDKDKFSSNNYKQSIKCLVQRDKRFFRINIGLWGLVSEKDNLPQKIKDLIDSSYTSRYDQESNHSLMQSHLINIGKSLGFNPYIPSQDKNRTFEDGKKLKDIIDNFKIPNFTYNELLKKIKSIDVIWFVDLLCDDEKYSFPKAIFEVESTTDFKRSLEKFTLLSAFNLQYMFIVAPKERENTFNRVIDNDEFKNIKPFVKFLRYEDIETFLANPQLLLRFNIV